MKKVLMILILILLVFSSGYFFEIDNKYIKEYEPGVGNIKGNVNIQYYRNLGKEFEIGANTHGYAVYKHPKQAAKKLEEMFPDAIKLLVDYTGYSTHIDKKNAYFYMNISRLIANGSLDNNEEYLKLKEKYPNANGFYTLEQTLDIYLNSYDRTYKDYSNN